VGNSVTKRAEREATRAVLTAVVINPVDLRINLTFLTVHCPNLFQLASLTETWVESKAGIIPRSSLLNLGVRLSPHPASDVL
jgi:hypothetical protein